MRARRIVRVEGALRAIPALLLIAALSACGAQRVDSAAEERSLMQTSREWSQAASTGDVDAIVNYWADDAVVMMPGLPTFTGKPAIRSYVEESLKVPGFRISWEPLEAHVSSSGDMAYLLERSEVTMPGPSGQLVTQQFRGVTIWKKDAGGDWKNVVDLSNAVAPEQPPSH
ncbi:YybH family protein [Brevundimonas sp. LjRoot202]|uniref:YybH family protein n=1 Tax=Brevundimonas sp. LjRoot202 TaxID=3342281 RepID=UPI003ECCF9AD